ncbi:MAG: response regulator transcription factor [Coriobacteriia bacterium]|nr:response regulator transcription factor [Coriobacteriia bacterium]
MPEKPAPLRLLVADDQPLVRSGLRMLVDSVDDMVIVGEAATGAAAVEMTRELLPDVVLMDIRMPEMDGVEATRRICTDPSTHDVRIMVLTTFDLDEYVFGALRAGASGFILKDADPDDLLEAIRLMASGETLLAPTATARLVAEFVRQPSADRAVPTDLAELTEREREVLTLVGRGLSNAEIGAEIFISLATAKTHVGRVLQKLGVRDRAQLVVVAYETGLVTPRPPA